MASGNFITFNDAVWKRKIAQYAAATQKNMREAINEEFPLLLRKVMDFTPPFQTGGAPGASDLSVGRAAVARDIFKTMRPFDPKVIRSKSLKSIVENQQVSLFNIIAAKVKSGPMKGARAVFFDRNIHTKARNARGRVTGADRNIVVIGQGVALLIAYVKEVQDRVGYAKSGWLKALLLVGGTAPAYVRKKGTAGGAAIDDRNNPNNPSITAINRTPWAVRKDEGDRILADAKLSRIQAIVSKIRVKERLAAKQAKLAA